MAWAYARVGACAWHIRPICMGTGTIEREHLRGSGSVAPVAGLVGLSQGVAVAGGQLCGGRTDALWRAAVGGAVRVCEWWFVGWWLRRVVGRWRCVWPTVGEW